MVNRRITKEIHAAALRGTLDPALPDENFRMALGGIHPRTVARAMERLERTGTVAFDTSKKGRPRQLDRATIEHIIWMATHDPIIDQKRIRKYLADIEIETTVSTISRTLNREGYSYRKLRKTALERSPYARADFAVRMADYGVEQLIWVDESAKDERTCVKSYGWGRRGHDTVIEAPFVRGERYSILPALTMEGYVALEIVRGSVNKEAFIAFLMESLFPMMNPFPGPRSVVVLNNCSIHTGQEIERLFDERGFRLEFLPAYFPDFNPIEESFSALKAFIRRQPDFLHSPDPIGDIVWATQQCITSEKALAWIHHSGYAV